MKKSGAGAAESDINPDGTRRTLKNRHVQMIAIGGTIGTGLFLGSGSTISKTGPSILFIYALIGLVFFIMMRAIGEMLYASPQEHTFVAFITKYLGLAPGLFAGWSYWLAIILGGTAELTAISIYVKYWFPNWNAALIQLFFLIILVSINSLTARLFGSTEFWFAMIKIVAIIALIVIGLIMIFTGFKDPNGQTSSFRNLTYHFQFFPHGINSFISGIPMVFFAFLSMEFVSITIGETKSPRHVLKKAINETVYRILIFYIGALTIIMSIARWTSFSPNTSPFVLVFKLAGIPAAATIINFVVITSAASSINSLLFSSGRHLYQLSMETNSKLLKPVQKISKSGVPANAVRMSGALFLIAPIISSIPAVQSAFDFIGAAASDLYLFVYVLVIFALLKYKSSSDYMANGFKMPAYKITAPLDIIAFGLIFITLFFNSDDVVPAIGSIIWLIIFGGFCYLRYHGKEPAHEM
ncbi:amino acid permease [Philodulcilactobacillus myokoensis]|uniref:Amino acid permease n=1 Tax=Philodulcilactobacillus myokoensis TaxID=2929573 RepID=A0A9W6B370_9LACO|nr:amino acid permease [Philodulcilactobacillus myokoensis]GLB47385.1 amino acid permease [Philodulcilactobacillus myokoensis]